MSRSGGRISAATRLKAASARWYSCIRFSSVEGWPLFLGIAARTQSPRSSSPGPGRRCNAPAARVTSPPHKQTKDPCHERRGISEESQLAALVELLVFLALTLHPQGPSSADHFGHELLQFLTAETGGGRLSDRRRSVGSVLGCWARLDGGGFRVRDGLHGSSLECRFGTQRCGPSLVSSERYSLARSGWGQSGAWKRVVPLGQKLTSETESQGWLDHHH